MEQGRLSAEQAADWAGRHLGLDSAQTFTIEEAARSLAQAAGLDLAAPVAEPPWSSHGIWEPGMPGQIYAAIAEAMRAVSPVAKRGHYNEGGTKYDYRRADDVFAAAHPALAEAGVFPVPIVRKVHRKEGAFKSGTLRIETILEITYRFTARDGSYVDVVIEVENWNASDKGIGAAMTVALRIALLQLLVIPTGDPDPDAGYPERGTAPALSDPLTAWLLEAIESEPVEKLEGVWKLLTAHVPDTSRVPGGDVDWWEVFARRYAAEVEALRSKDDLAALWKRIGPWGLGFGVGAGRQVADMITSHNATLLAEHRAAMDEARHLIAAATNDAEIDHARSVVQAHLQAKRIGSADSLTLLDILTRKIDDLHARAENVPDAYEDQATEQNYDGEPA